MTDSEARLQPHALTYTEPKLLPNGLRERPLNCPACGAARGRDGSADIIGWGDYLCGTKHTQQEDVVDQSLKCRLCSVGSIDVESLPVTWNEWGALDGQEKAATLNDFFLIVAELTGQKH